MKGLKDVFELFLPNPPNLEAKSSYLDIRVFLVTKT
jgi:hypothetical protein